RQLLVELAHRRQELLARHLARFGILRGLDQHHDSHRSISLCRRATDRESIGPWPLALPGRRTEPSEIDTGSRNFGVGRARAVVRQGVALARPRLPGARGRAET